MEGDEESGVRTWFWYTFAPAKDCVILTFISCDFFEGANLIREAKVSC